MAEIRSGRWTAQTDGDVVVFLIGMRINDWRAVRQWWPVFTAMPKMLREQAADNDSGMLGYRLLFAGPGVRWWCSIGAASST